jgi:hypothetical protein
VSGRITRGHGAERLFVPGFSKYTQGHQKAEQQQQCADRQIGNGYMVQD